MRSKPVLVYCSPERREPPSTIEAVARAEGLTIVRSEHHDDVLVLVNRGYPTCIVMDARGGEPYLTLCRTLKDDPFSAVVPVAFHAPDADDAWVRRALEAGADEVLGSRMDERERVLRSRMMLTRANRAVSVHPTTRLPGTAQIARDIAERLGRDEKFAVCYADLDHFKEFNDRYGYEHGDGVILLVSRILRDVVKAYADDGFIGHIGGDDFVCNMSLDVMPRCCEEIIEIFDELMPFQYTAEDRAAGHFMGKDRRGNVFEVPLMTLSIGVVTNQKRVFTHPARVGELATEMKTYAKTLSGSVYAVDRRSDRPVEGAAAGDADSN